MPASVITLTSLGVREHLLSHLFLHSLRMAIMCWFDYWIDSTMTNSYLNLRFLILISMREFK